MLSPKRTKYRKPHHGHQKGRGFFGHLISFGEYGIQALESGWVSSRQIESTRRVLTRYVRRSGKLWIRIFPDKLLTKRASETRIGSGKGSADRWVAVIRPGTIIFELRGISINVAHQARRISRSKLPTKVHFVIKIYYD